MSKIKFLNDRVCINVLAKDLDNAVEIYNAAEGHVLVGILSKNFKNTSDAYKEMKKWANKINNNISIGLGAGDPKQSFMVAELVKKLNPNHANQVFTGVGLTIDNIFLKNTFVNCLISPTGRPGFVKISTGPLSSTMEDGIIAIDTAIAMIKDMGGDSIKFFPMNGLQTIEEFKIVCDACAQYDMAIEPTGGIDLINYREILNIAVSASVKKIIPHIYSSIINKDGNTNIDAIKQIMTITREVLGE